jgi:hypothetical protein
MIKIHFVVLSKNKGEKGEQEIVVILKRFLRIVNVL